MLESPESAEVPSSTRLSTWVRAFRSPMMSRASRGLFWTGEWLFHFGVEATAGCCRAERGEPMDLERGGDGALRADALSGTSGSVRAVFPRLECDRPNSVFFCMSGAALLKFSCGLLLVALGLVLGGDTEGACR